MKYFLYCLLVFGGAWVLRIVFGILYGLTTGNLEKKRSAFSGIINNFIYYIFATVLLFSYDLFVPMIFFSLNMYKTFAWLISLSILGSMIYASIGCVTLALESVEKYGFGKGFCFVTAFIFNIKNINVVCPAIKSFFETAYKSIPSLPFDILTVAVFIFDVVLFVYMLKQVKKIRATSNNSSYE